MLTQIQPHRLDCGCMEKKNIKIKNGERAVELSFWWVLTAADTTNHTKQVHLDRQCLQENTIVH